MSDAKQTGRGDRQATLLIANNSLGNVGFAEIFVSLQQIIQTLLILISRLSPIYFKYN